MRIAFYGGQTAGLVTLLTLIAFGQKINYVFAEDEKIRKISKTLGLTLKDINNLDNHKFIDKLSKKIDLFMCCHGKKILQSYFTNSIPSVNIHPCLYKYKGISPIKRLIEEGNSKASVGSHWMTRDIDSGKKIVEIFKKIENVSTKCEAEVYNELYPVYQQVTVKTLSKIII